MTLGTLILISLLIFVVASLYSSVGHGGASGYLAVLSFFAFSPATMSSTALLLNILVSGVAVYSFHRGGHLLLRLTWPFILLSVPAAFLGGLLHIADRTYFFVLAAVLVLAAVRLAMAPSQRAMPSERKRVNPLVSLPVGGGIGLVSGVVGIGGGIFLSPLMILMNWADPKKTAATSALFILVNSLAGLAARFARDSVQAEDVLPLIVAAFLGGWVGSHYGANRFSGLLLRRVLAAVLIVAAAKMVLASS
ncbi:MAG: sulfite exporter TauE/SafE family protein [Ignavibacteria bacterium]|nr:sulfite exporter TauE/SafE family protein [Ignavibacteria bacterium]